MKKVLIIGGAGFVGYHLIRHLQGDLGWGVSATKLPNEHLAMSGVEIFDLDILQKDQIVTLFMKTRPDAIFHLAAQSSVALSWKNPALTVDVNVKGAVQVLEAARALDYKPRLLLIGSAEEYGRAEPGDRPIDEQTVPRPGNIYAATKTCQNMLGKIYADAYGLDVLMVRAFNHVGPGQPFGFVVPDFCRQIVEIEIGKREPVVKVGNLSARRDFTDVRDVVRAYSLLIERGQAGETYNIGSGHAVEMRAILEKLLALSPAKITVEADPQKFRPVDVPVVEAGITKLHELTRWRPQILLEQTLADTLGYWRAKIKAETV